MVFHVLKGADLAENGLQVLPYLLTKSAIDNVFKGGNGFGSRFVHPALVNAQVPLDHIQPPQYFRLREQYAFQQFFSFSHVVFLLLVGGVAASTLSGIDVAFYLGGAV